MLLFSMIIVASRPVGTTLVRKKAPVKKRIEILGFKKEEILSYVKSYFEHNKDAGSKLLSYLHLHANVLHMCYLPVHAAMICFLYSEEGDDIPQTETKIYERFTCSTLVRTLNRDNSDPVKINSLNALTGEDKDSFSKICRLAFDMTIDSQQVVLQSTAKFPLSDASASDTPSLGLVTIDSRAKWFGMDDVYTFLHLTFQEYLAAYHIAGLEQQHQVEITDTHGNKPILQMMWKFFCGIVRFEEKSLLNHVMSCIGTNILYKAQCAFESQQKIVCDNVLELEKITDTLIFMDHSLMPTDFLAISYVISTTRYVVTTMTFTECKLDGEGITLFLEKMSSVHLNNIKHLITIRFFVTLNN